jgi:hypothetical protein
MLRAPDILALVANALLRRAHEDSSLAQVARRRGAGGFNKTTIARC